MKSPSQLREAYSLTSMRLICIEDEIKQKISEGEKLHKRKLELRDLIKKAEMKDG